MLLLREAAMLLMLLQLLLQLSSTAALPFDSSSLDSNEVCYGEFGCFRNDGHFWNIQIRPISKLPESPEKINTRFQLFTRSNKKKPQAIKYKDKASVANSNFLPDREIKILVHGFQSDIETNWMYPMRDALMQHGDYNLLLVDWKDGNAFPYYQATANTRVVGAVLGQMIRWLETEFGATRGNMHLIGHSLGAHIVGYAGERLGGRVRRITGLDPAGPYFEYMHPIVRLDETDGQFVDVLHTDGSKIINIIQLKGGFGLMQPLGHVDFYPNGGKQQTSCPGGIITAGNYTANPDDAAQYSRHLCNHWFAWELATTTVLNSHRAYKAVPCDSYDNFKAGKCKCGSTGCASVGINADKWNPRGKKNVKMFLDTSAQPPYEVKI